MQMQRGRKMVKNDPNGVYKVPVGQVANKCNQIIPIVRPLLAPSLSKSCTTLLFPSLSLSRSLLASPSLSVCHFFCFTFALFALKCDHKNSMRFGAQLQEELKRYG